MSVPPISAIGFGLSGVPTPRQTDWKNGKQREDFGMNLPTFAKQWPTPCATDNSDRKPSANVHISAAGLPKHIAPNGEKSQMRLSQAVQMWPTPVARDYRHPGRSRMERTGGTQGEPLPQQVGGALNPTWVEWLMGWPLGWTDLKPLGTDKSLSAPLQLGDCSMRESKVAA